MKSYRTTLLGILGAVAIIIPQAIAHFDGNITTIPDYGLVIAAVFGALGFGVTRDNKVTSKDAGAE